MQTKKMQELMPKYDQNAGTKHAFKRKINVTLVF